MLATTLNEKQVDLLRALHREGRPVHSEGFDGRVVRALCLRGLVAENAEMLRLTESGAAEFERLRRRRIAPGGAQTATREARAEAIVRAAQALQLALPSAAEVMVGDMTANGVDILEALRRYARELAGGERGAPARPGSVAAPGRPLY